MFRFKKFTGGAFETNAFFVEAPEGNLLFDAPEGAAEVFRHEKIGLLVLTHGHFDHVIDAAQILRQHKCRCAIARDSVPLVNQRDAARKFGLPFTIEPFEPDVILAEGENQSLLGLQFTIYEVPGHCPGSLCFYQPESGHLVGGDVLFSGGVGRWDLPGGDRELLFRGIREKLYRLPDATIVHPGHGPDTTIGAEKSSNPFVRP